ncbi:MAG: hypothetical protein U0169_26570, partial [Polyangiaceae bacterium]
MRRILAVHLPSVRIEFVRARMESTEARESAGAGSSPQKPLALVVTGTAHGTVKDERSLLGNTRLDEVSDEARALGIHPRDTIASARARASDLEVRVLSEDSIREVLERIADSLFAFGATTSVDVATNTVWVDVTGCTHLHGEGIQGERALVTKVLDHVRAR